MSEEKSENSDSQAQGSASGSQAESHKDSAQGSEVKTESQLSHSEDKPETKSEEAAKTDASSSADLKQAASPVAFDEAAKRRSPWQAAAAALQYVQESTRTDSIQLRTSDRVTIIALLVCCILEVLSLSYTPFAGMRLPIVIVCDVVLGVCTILFLVYRLGILCSLSPRQALVCWQLMMGCVFFGIFLCINIGVGVAFAVSGMGAEENTVQSP
ncbi:MAG: hypothetical protein K2Y32_22345 [Candidatus Obscuribacterales bacterium]|nr:hypothetical protein [Candidatus Obscuribacterales bacterium]